jgi:hypothetical protein
MFTFSKFFQIDVITAMEKLNQTPEQKLKKRKPLPLKESTPVKKSKFTFLHFMIFRKRKNGDRRGKGRCSHFSQAAFLNTKARLYE